MGLLLSFQRSGQIATYTDFITLSLLLRAGFFDLPDKLMDLFVDLDFDGIAGRVIPPHEDLVVTYL